MAHVLAWATEHEMFTQRTGTVRAGFLGGCVGVEASRAVDRRVMDCHPLYRPRRPRSMELELVG